MKILSVWAREILDSRGNPTIEVEVATEQAMGSAAAPSGASTGKYEAYELRDGDSRYHGKGVLRAVGNVNNIIAPSIVGMDVNDQASIDGKIIGLDGSPNKENLGANAMVATSMAVLRAASASKGKQLFQYLGGTTLPSCMFNIINGGKHAGGSLAIQEFMIIPQADLFSERLRMASEIYHTLGKMLVQKYGAAARNVGDEGGFAPSIDNSYKALDAISDAIEELGYDSVCGLAIDAAASSFYDGRVYRIDGKTLSENDLIDYYKDLVSTYEIKSVEDPFHEESFEAFAALLREMPALQVVGDDLVVSNPKRIADAIAQGSMSALLLKINQVGTVTEAMEAARLCRDRGLGVIVSHRSGETEDPFIADFAVGINAGQMKTGAPARGERTSKYNQLLRIEEMMALSAAEAE
jgi:enolase